MPIKKILAKLVKRGGTENLKTSNSKAKYYRQC